MKKKKRGRGRGRHVVGRRVSREMAKIWEDLEERIG